MKKTIFIAIVGAITLLLAACGNGSTSRSGNFKKMSTFYDLTFVPVEIQVSEPSQDTSVNDNGFKTLNYNSSIYYLDSLNKEYALHLCVYIEADYTGKFSKEDLESLKKTKQFFKKMSKVNPRTLYIKYYGKRPEPCIFVHKQITNSERPPKYINNAKVRESRLLDEDKSLIWQSTSIGVPAVLITASAFDNAEG